MIDNETLEWMELNCELIIFHVDQCGIRSVGISFRYESSGLRGLVEAGSIEYALEAAIVEQKK